MIKKMKFAHYVDFEPSNGSDTPSLSYINYNQFYQCIIKYKHPLQF